MMTNMTRKVKVVASKVEKNVLLKSGAEPLYPPTEKNRTIIVDNFSELGKLAAFRFIEWTLQNSGWTIALPTGKTPEYFIKWVMYILNNWQDKEVIQYLEEYEIDPATKPDMKSFSFVQIDEFYPINSWQHNSFYYYVNKYYIEGFGLDATKALLIDPNKIGLADDEELNEIWPNQIVNLSLRTDHPKNSLEKRQSRLLTAVDQFCTDYEKKIRSLGGIGFFLGGIGPDGHIGFNVQGSDHFSTTRLTETNYETQAAAAVDLGGIEISRNRLVVTIGLQTIVYSPETTAIIIAAGEAKAKIVKEAIESDECNKIPATILQNLKNAAFYLTKGAASLLTERRHLNFEKVSSLRDIDKIKLLTDVALVKKSRIVDLDKRAIKETRSGPLLLKQLNNDFNEFQNQIAEQYQSHIKRALTIPKDQVFLHTAPHHDDIVLGYLPYLVRLLREPGNTHFFNYLTSGFTAVTNMQILAQIKNTHNFFKTAQFKRLFKENYFDPQNKIFKSRDVYQYLDGLAANDHFLMNEGIARRVLRNLNEIYKENSTEEIGNRFHSLINYFEFRYPGKKDTADVQLLKGMMREWESEVLWGYFGFSVESVIHSRLGFYKGDIFTEDPEHERDIKPILKLLHEIHPTIITVAFDPEGSGPDTHYKVLQAITSALKLYQQETSIGNIEIWGYRNVWNRYHPADANLIVPVTFNGMAILEDSFLNSFVSQANASFPSYEFDGPFSSLAKQIHVEQYQDVKTLLGRDFFYQNRDSRIRSTRGLIYLKIMELDEFYTISRELKKSIESR